MVKVMFWYGGHWAFWPAALMWVLMLVFWGLLIWAVYALVTAALRRPHRHDEGGGAREILDQRLARGQIDSAEYQRLRDLIGADDRQSPADAESVR
jgi:putative membrane protein